MNTSRRTLLKGAAAIPAAAVVATAGLGRSAAEVATAAPTTPYTQYPWKWFVSHDKEIYHDCFDTIEDALTYAKSSDYAFVAECRQQDFDLDVEGYDIIEHINDQNSDRIGDGEGIECSAEQEVDLGRMVTAAVEAWAVKHNISITAWSFAETRNLAEVPVPNEGAKLSSQDRKNG